MASKPPGNYRWMLPSLWRIPQRSDIDPVVVALYIYVMTTDNALAYEEQKIKKLEFSVDELARICERLQQENVQLRNERAQLLAEQSQLAEKNYLARDKMEKMVTRLKHMESEL